MTQHFSILHTEWSNGWGGQEQRIILESRAMMQRGHQVVIACQPASGILAKAVEQGIPVEEIVIRSSFDIRAVLNLCAIIKRHRIDIVNTHSGKDTWVGSFAAKLAGVDLLVRTRHLSLPISSNPFNFVHRMPDGIVTTGEAIRNTMIAQNGIRPDRIVSIATGVSLGRFYPCTDGRAVRRGLGIPDSCRVVTMVAVLRGMKRHDLLVKASEILRHQHPETRYLLVGEGPGRPFIEGYIKEAGMESNFILTGYRSDIPELLAASDVVVLTSDRFEGVPQSLSQAMAMERAVVAAPVGSIPELVVDGETGLLAETGSARSFAEQIGKLLADGDLRSVLGKRARSHILEGYTDDIMAEKTLAFYNELLDKKKLRRRND